ncbi:chemotaxis protein CheW [Noviherbaspirillum sp. ST9]|uniref:chemotaxis protein CheW n=1 Tax=Noviherbaspirillum sp. ST9 TaxID=3401606 RepID=UPI003B585B79
MSVIEHASQNESPAAREFLSFRIGAEEYGLDLLSVQEIRGYEPCTLMANSPNYVKGMVNLRGIIVPIVDLRVRLGVPDPSYDALTVVIILNLQGCTGTVGIVVDSVKDVVALTTEQIRPAPEVGGGIAADALLGIGTVDGDMVILLDIEKILSGIGIGRFNRRAA